jgi:Fe-S oxidoreductase
MNCGLCNTVDPILAAVKKESASSRFKIVLAKQGKPSPLFYLTTDPGMQEAICPAGVKFTDIFQQMRERNRAEGITTEANERLFENFKRTGTPYETMVPEDFHDKPIW